MSWKEEIKKDSRMKRKLEILLEKLESGPNAEMSVSYAIGYVKGLLRGIESTEGVAEKSE